MTDTAVARTYMPAPRLFNLPDSVVDILKRSERTNNRIAGVTGVVVALVVSGGLTILAPKGNMVAALFDLRTPNCLAPLLILVMATWSVCWSWLRFIRIRALEQASSPKLVTVTVQCLKDLKGKPAPLETLLNYLPKEKDDQNVSPILTRVRALTRQWSVEPGAAPADVILQHYLYQDEEDVTKAYTHMRTFVWAMPVLGLIGTVLGIARAVGGFSTFLHGAGDIEQVKTHLVGVTTGLSFAFMITMLGLVGSLVAMGLISVLQLWEERIVAGAQNEVADTFLPELQRVVPVTPHGGGDMADGPMTEIKKLLEGLKASVDTLPSEISTAAATLTDGVREVTAGAQTVAISVRDSAATAASDIRDAAKWLAASVETAASDAQGVARVMADAASSTAAEVRQAGDDLGSAMEQAASNGRQLADALGDAAHAATESVIVARQASAQAVSASTQVATEAAESARRASVEVAELYASIAASATSTRDSMKAAAEQANLLSNDVRAAFEAAESAYRMQRQVANIRGQLGALVDVIGRIADSAAEGAVDEPGFQPLRTVTAIEVPPFTAVRTNAGYSDHHVDPTPPAHN